VLRAVAATASSVRARLASAVMGASSSAASASATLKPIIRSHSASARLAKELVTEAAVEQITLGRAGPLPGERDQDRPFPLAEVVTRRLPGLLRIAEHAEDVVAELERDADRDAVTGERRDRPVRAGQRRPEVQRALDGVLRRLVPDHPQRAVDRAI